MSYLKKRRPATNAYLTDADRMRLASVEHDPRNDWQKLKHKIVLKNKNISQEVVFFMYGKDEAELKANIASQLKFFKDADKSWEISEDIDMKAGMRQAQDKDICHES